MGITAVRVPLVLIMAVGFFAACGSSGDEDGPSDDDIPATGGRSNGGSFSGGSSSGGSSSGAGAGGRGSGGADPSGTGGAETANGGSGDGGEAGAGTGGSPSGECAFSTEPTGATVARSAGFAGTDEQYAALYDEPCTESSDCVAPCVSSGGTEEFCSGSECIHSSTDYCLPPTKWRLLSGALQESAGIESAAVTSLSYDDGSDHDRLILEKFLFEIPETATIHGIAVQVRHGAEGPNEARDQVVRLLKDGGVGQTDRSKLDVWSMELTEVDYGGALDSWGESWTPEAINADGFGVAIAALPVDGGGRAYVDFVSVVVHYSAPCED
jgi:hypothetical protein